MQRPRPAPGQRAGHIDSLKTRSSNSWESNLLITLVPSLISAGLGLLGVWLSIYAFENRKFDLIHPPPK